MALVLCCGRVDAHPSCFPSLVCTCSPPRRHFRPLAAAAAAAAVFLPGVLTWAQLPDSCPSLQRPALKQPYITGAVGRGGDRQKPPESIRPLFEGPLVHSHLDSASSGFFSSLKFQPSLTPPPPPPAPQHTHTPTPTPPPTLSVFIHLGLTTALVNIISTCPCARPQVETLIHRGTGSLDMRLKKQKNTTDPQLSGESPRLKDYPRPCGLLARAAPPTSCRCIVHF